MTELTDEQRELNRVVRLERAKKALARDLAQEHAAKALDALIADVPDWFDAYQVHAYVKELERLRERIAGPRYLDPEWRLSDVKAKP
jgi:hypothetical protein